MVETLATVPVAYRIGPRTLYAPLGGQAMFTENETNPARVPGFRPRSGASRFVKDAFHRQVVNQEASTNPDLVGSKAALHYRLGSIRPGETVTLHFRFSDTCYIADPLADVGPRSTSAAPRRTLITRRSTHRTRARTSATSSGKRCRV